MAAGITVGAARRNDGHQPGVSAIAAVTGYLMTSYTRKDQLLRFGEAPQGGPLQQLAKRDLRLAIITLSALAGRPQLGLLAGGVLGHLDVLAQLRERASAPVPAPAAS